MSIHSFPFLMQLARTQLPFRRFGLPSLRRHSSAFTPSLCTASRSFCKSRPLWEAATPAARLTAADFAALGPQVLLRQALQQYTELDGTQIGEELHPGASHVLISREKFVQFCAAAHVEDPDAALSNLEAAGVVVVLDGGELVHLRPVLYLETVALLSAAAESDLPTPSSSSSSSSKRGNSSETVMEDAAVQAGAPSSSASALTSSPIGAFMVEEAEHRIENLRQKEQAMATQLEPAIARAAKWRRSVWGGALLFAGTQLAVISRLTYFDLDWDIMEPVSYCIAIGTALVFYGYYLCYNEEHTYEAFDQRFLPKKVRQYAPKDFDWTAYEAVCAQLVEERAMLERVRRWAERH